MSKMRLANGIGIRKIPVLYIRYRLRPLLKITYVTINNSVPDFFILELGFLESEAY